MSNKIETPPRTAEPTEAELAEARRRIFAEIEEETRQDRACREQVRHSYRPTRAAKGDN